MAALCLCSADPVSLTGRIVHSQEILAELGVDIPVIGAIERWMTRPQNKEFSPPLTRLSDIRVLEVTTGVAAPLVGRVLAELGAQVTKLESRGKLDVNRMRIARPEDPAGYPAHESFQLLHESNADKQSITLNLKSPEGKEVFLDLLRDTDVLIQNFAPGWLDRIGFTFDQLLEECPRLVILSATGYGHVGPLRAQRAYAPVMTALAGVEGLIGYADGEVMGCSALALADLNCSFHGVFLIMAALIGRQASGRGQHIDLSQTEAAASLIGEAFIEQQLGVSSPGPRGNFGPDGEQWAVLAADGEDHWVVASAPHQATGSILAGPADRPGRAELLRRLRKRGRTRAGPVAGRSRRRSRLPPPRLPAVSPAPTGDDRRAHDNQRSLAPGRIRPRGAAAGATARPRQSTVLRATDAT